MTPSRQDLMQFLLLLYVLRITHHYLSHKFLTSQVTNIAFHSAAVSYQVAQSAVIPFQLPHTILHSCVGELPFIYTVTHLCTLFSIIPHMSKASHR